VRNLVLAPPNRATALGIGGLVVSAVLTVYLNVVASGQMSVLTTTMSDYVFVSGVGWMFGASLLAMCVAGIGTAVGLARVRLFGNPLLRLAIGLAVVGLVLAAVFRTDLGESLSTSAQIHRYAAGVVFFCVPIAALLVARQLRDIAFLARHRKSLYVSVIVTTVVLTAFLTSHLGAMPPAIQDLNGLFQRLLFAAELVLLAQLTLLPQRFTPLSRTPGSPPPSPGGGPEISLPVATDRNGVVDLSVDNRGRCGQVGDLVAVRLDSEPRDVPERVGAVVR
jgi:uncharacterized protein DUF998